MFLVGSKVVIKDDPVKEIFIVLNNCPITRTTTVKNTDGIVLVYNSKDLRVAKSVENQLENSWDEAVRGQKMSNPQGYTVFKYPIPILEKFTLKLPKKANILRIDHIDGLSWLWALIDVNAPTEERTFVAFKTGGTNPHVKSVDNLSYVGYYEIYVQQGLGLYVFEVK